MEKNPLINELQTMKQRMETLYLKSFSGQEADKTDTDAKAATWQPCVDVWESEEEWIVVADLPGVQDEDLSVEVLDNQLTIGGNRKFNLPGKGKGLKASKTERPEGQFSRTFMLPPNALKDSIQAECKRGVLTITIPIDHGSQVLHHKVVVHSE